MDRENGDIQGLWRVEEDVVPMTSTETPTTNGDRSDLDRDDEHIPAGAARLTAGEFTSERMMPSAAPAPASGWRRALYLLSGGLATVGPSAAELRHRELVAQVKTPITGCRKIAFISRKGGVGKTTTCLMVGHTFAAYRGDRVVALDANPDAGTLAQRLRRETSETVATLVRDQEMIGRYADVRAYSSQAPSRLEVIAGDERSEIADTLGGPDVGRAIGVLERHYNLICLDTAAGVLGSAAQGVLAAADQAVIVSPTSIDGARAASSTLDWLVQHGHDGLASSAVAVLNGITATNGGVDIGRIEEHFAARCRACIRIPRDPHLETGAEVALEQLGPGTRQAFLELAAAIACGFDEPTQRRS
ncbi:MAG: MinD/ParA family protein [Gaiellaceae bacterium]